MVRIGIIGCGGMGRMHSQACRAVGAAQLIAVADERLEKAKELADKTGCQCEASPADLLRRDDIEAVMICTPTTSHHPLAMQALSAGKHVFSEKPLARTLALAEELVAKVRSSGKFAQVGHVLRFWPEYLYLKKALEEKRWGKLILIKLGRFCAQPSWAENNWYIDPAVSGGAALDLHLHDTDMVHFLFGKPKAVFSRGVNDVTGWIHLLTHYDFPNGPAVHAEGTWYNAEKYAFRMFFVAAFEGGTLDYDCSRNPMLVFYPQKGEAVEPELSKPVMTEVGEGINISDLGGYLLQDQYFFECLEAGKAPVVATFADGRDALATVEAEIRSAETREWVSV